MTVSHLEATRNLIANVVVDQLDSGGTLVFYQADGTTVVATLDLDIPAFGAAAVGIAEASTITSDPSAVGGTTTKAKLITTGAAQIIECSVGIGSGDIQLSDNVIAATDTVSISALTYEAAP